MDFLEEYARFAEQRANGNEAVKLAILNILLDTYRGKGQLLEDFANWQLAEHKKAGVVK